MSKQANMIKKVKALLAKAQATEFEGEREAFQAKAETLIQQWAIESSQLAEVDAGKVERFSIEIKGWGNATSGVVNSVGLIIEAGHPAYCAGWAGKNWNGKLEGYVRVFCTAAEFELIQVRIDHLLLQLRSMILRDRPHSRKSYAAAWGWEVADRLRAARSSAFDKAGAVVPLADEQRRMRDASVSGRSMRSMNGSAEGARAGRATDLGQTRVQGTPMLGR